MDRKRQEPKQTKEEYRMPELIRHGTIDELTRGGEFGQADATFPGSRLDE